MKCIVNGKLVLEDRVVDSHAIIFDGRIEKIIDESEININDYEIIDAKGNFILPGLIDMHIHGYLGADASDGDADGIRKMAKGIIQNGVTSWCPTTMTVSKKEIEKAFDSVREVRNSGEYYGARILGVNSEGPFINPEKKGAQAEEHILKPDAEFIKKHSDIIKLFTVAPEVQGALECIEKAANGTDILVSMGHTNASYEEAVLGIEKGVRHTTHLFNAMTPLSHRSPGVTGAALSDSRAAAIYETMGVYFGYAIAYYSMFYDIKHVLIMGRVTSGNGGTILLEKANEVLKTEFPELFEKVKLHIPDEKARRVGQSVAAASLPKIR